MKRFGVPATARASFAAYNTLDEVEDFGRAMHKALSLLDKLMETSQCIIW